MKDTHITPRTRAAIWFLLAVLGAAGSPVFAGDKVVEEKPLPPNPATEKASAAALPLPPPSLSVYAGTWVSQGPAGIANGQSEGIAGNPVVGAIRAIAAHPTNADVVWIGAVNGGVWKTTNATNVSPTWTPMGDAFASLSIGALQLDPTDATHNTLVAGHGRYSSYALVGGPRSGILRTTNGGTNWTAPASSGLIGNTDSGASFTRISGVGGTGLPMGTAFDVAGDPTNNAILYTAVRYAGLCSGGVNGVYKSTDTGATWTKVSDVAMDAIMASDDMNNAR